MIAATGIDPMFLAFSGLVAALFGGASVYGYLTVRSQNKRNEAEARNFDSQTAKTDVDRAQGLVAINEHTLANVESELKRQDNEIEGLRNLVVELRAELDQKDVRLREMDGYLDSLRKRLFDVLERLDVLHTENLQLKRYLAEARERAAKAGSASPLNSSGTPPSRDP